MHILIVSYDFCLEAGGIQNTSFLLAKELAKYSEITCFAPADSHNVDITNVSFVRSRYSQWTIQRFSYKVFKELLNIHKKNPIDYVLSTTYHVCHNVTLFSLICNVPYGILTHGNEVMPIAKSSLFKTMIAKLKRKLILSNSTHIFSNSHFTKDLVLKIINCNNVYIIYPPISYEPSYNCLNYKKRRLFSVGRIVERKGFQNVIKALPEVIKKYDDIQYIIAGDGEYLQNLKELSDSLGVNEYVHFVGKVTEKEKDDLFSQCGLFVMPSYSIPSLMQVEGFGLVYLEAYVHGKFVIGSATGGVPDAIQDGITGFLIKENDYNDLAKAICRFYDNDFQYNPQLCFKKASEHHVSIIARNYFEVIRKDVLN